MCNRIPGIQQQLIGIFLAVLSTALIFSSCDQKQQSSVGADAHVIHVLNEYLTEAIIQDGFPPPVASRIYAHCNLSAHEVIASTDESYGSFNGKLNGLDFEMDVQENANVEVAIIEAFVEVGKEMVYRDHILDEGRKVLFDKMGVSSDNDGLVLGQTIAGHIIDRSRRDNYKETRNYPNYTLKEGKYAWKPTPPTYREALEPYWNHVQPFVIDSASQYLRLINVDPSTDPDSKFYEHVMEVYDSVNNSSAEDSLIAHFWDCNPLLTKQSGHLMFNVRQLTPGGHWVGITRIAAMNEGFDLNETVRAYSLVSIALADGFITAWDTKYRTNFIRPETYINQYIDPYWKPLLETPPFPEHTSAHSTVSAAAATVLTEIFGTSYAFVDSTEVPFGLPPRSFNSFFEASDEASVSRILGGIHYRPAIELGIWQGKAVGRQVLTELYSD